MGGRKKEVIKIIGIIFHLVLNRFGECHKQKGRGSLA